MSAEKDALDAYWTNWLRNSMRMGVDLAELLGKLRKAGFTDKAIADGFDAVRPTNDATEQLMSPPLVRRKPPNLRKFDDPRVDMYTLEGFLSRRECERLIALIDHHLTPSTVSFDNGDKYFRTSYVVLPVAPEKSRGGGHRRQDLPHAGNPARNMPKPSRRSVTTWPGVQAALGLLRTRHA